MRPSDQQRRRLLALHSARRGAVALEFAIIIPLLAAMLLAGIHYGMLIWSHNQMYGAARAAARSLAVSGATEAAARTTALANLPGWVDPAAWTVISQDIGSTGTNEVRATITVPVAAVSVLPQLWLVPSPTELTATVVMRKQA